MDAEAEAEELLLDALVGPATNPLARSSPGEMRATLRGLITMSPVTGIPAVVDVVLEPRPGGGSRVTARTTAKQSLAQRQVAVKAAQRLLDTYEQATAAPPPSPDESA